MIRRLWSFGTQWGTRGRLRWLAGLGCAVALLAGQGCGGSAQSEPAKAERKPAITAAAIDAALDSAQQYITADRLANAEAILLTLIEQAPREARARELYGQVLTLYATQAEQRADVETARARRAQAYEQYSIAAEIEKTSPGLQHSAGMVAMAAGEAEAALRYFQAAGRLDPANPQHPLFEAQILIQQRRFDEATAALNRVLQLDPDEAMALASLAIIAMEQSRFDQALQLISQARQINPHDLGLRMQEAKIYRRKGDPKRSLELLLGLSAAERAEQGVAYEIAANYELLGDYLKAAAAWQHVHQTRPLAPNAWMAAVRVGEALVKAGQREQAWLWLQTAKAAAPNQREVRDLEASINRLEP